MADKKTIALRILFKPEDYFILQEIGHKTDIKNKSGKSTVTKVIDKALQEFINKYKNELTIS
jgi:predicted ATP-binding protein involved in virulence